MADPICTTKLRPLCLMPFFGNKVLQKEKISRHIQILLFWSQVKVVERHKKSKKRRKLVPDISVDEIVILRIYERCAMVDTANFLNFPQTLSIKGCIFGQHLYTCTFETQRQGPDHQCGPIKVRGPIDQCGPKEPLSFFCNPSKKI